MFSTPSFAIAATLFLITTPLAVIGAWRLFIQELLPLVKRIGLIGILLTVLGLDLIFEILGTNDMLYRVAAFVSLGVLALNGAKTILGRLNPLPRLHMLK